MKYFDTFPKIAITDEKGNAQVYVNLLKRLSVIPSILRNPLLYYEYQVQDGDTPEIVAYKYYGDVNRFWIVLYSNNILDPQWGWPLSSRNLADYIDDKYTDPTQPHSWEKIITTTNLSDNTSVSETYKISESQYNSMVESSQILDFVSGSVEVSETKRILSLYEYEVEQNDAKRGIKLLNKDYAGQLEEEFRNLMG